MVPQTQARPPRNSSRVNLLISLVFHGLILLALVYFAAREGLLGKELKKIAVEMVREKPPEKPKEVEPEPEPAVEQLVPETPATEPPKLAESPPPQASDPATTAPPSSDLVAPPPAAPPAAQLPSFAFAGGRAVQSSSDPAQLYKGLIEYTLRSRWNRPVDVADHDFIAEVEVAVARDGRIHDPAWKKSSGHASWDASVREALATAGSVGRPPPTNFPARVLVRFDVQEVNEATLPLQ